MSPWNLLRYSMPEDDATSVDFPFPQRSEVICRWQEVAFHEGQRVVIEHERAGKVIGYARTPSVERGYTILVSLPRQDPQPGELEVDILAFAPEQLSEPEKRRGA